MKKILTVSLLFFLALSVFAGAQKEKTDAAAPAASKSVAANTDPFGKFDPPVTITVARRDWGNPIPTGKDAPWTLKYKEYGINMEVAWAADASQTDTKINTAIASGDIPDLMQVIGAEQMNQLVRADLLADLTDVYQKYASPLVKEYFSTPAGKAALESATFDGKLRFIPVNVTESLNDMNGLFIRKDWLDNLGLAVPKTIEDVKKIAIAFTKNDPDKNGKNDTYGFVLTKNSFGGATNLFTAWDLFPGKWYDGMLFYSKDKDGKITWDGEKPEMKQALAFLSDLYKAGAIQQDFAVYDNNRKFEDMTSGKAGMSVGSRGYPAWAVQNTYVNNPKAEWYGMQIPGLTADKKATLLSFQPLNSAFAVSKKCKNPEAVIRMLNLVTEISAPSSAMFEEKFLRSNRTVTGDSIIYAAEDPNLERKSSQSIFKAVKANSKAGLNKQDEKVYDDIMLFEKTKDAKAWSSWNRFYPAPGHIYYEIYEMNKDTVLKNNAWRRLPTLSMTPKLAVWNKLFDEAFVQVVTTGDMSYWDKALDSWAKLGGDQITEEVRKLAK